MTTMIENLKPEMKKSFRVPSFPLKDGEKFKTLMEMTALNATQLATKIIEFALTHDPGIKKALEKSQTELKTTTKVYRDEKSAKSNELLVQSLER